MSSPPLNKTMSLMCLVLLCTVFMLYQFCYYNTVLQKKETSTLNWVSFPWLL